MRLSFAMKEPTGRDRSSWAIALPDNEVYRWGDVAICGFWIRHPKALDSENPYRPSRLTRAQREFVRFGVELQALEFDLYDCVNEFKTSYQVLYHYVNALRLKKFSIVYHVDNFNVRVHKLRENIYRLIELTLGLDQTRGREQSEQLRHALAPLRLVAVADALRAFEYDPLVKTAMNDRHRFVHLFRDEGDKHLSSEARIRDLTRDEDEVSKGIRWVSEIDAIDDCADQRADQLLEILRRIATVRNEICYSIAGKAVSMAKSRPRGIPERMRAFVELWEELL